MSENYERLLGELRRTPGAWRDAKTLGRLCTLSTEKVCVLLETARKNGKGVQRRGNEHAGMEFRVPKEAVLTRAPVVASTPDPGASPGGNGTRYVHAPALPVPPAVRTPTRLPASGGFKLGDVAHETPAPVATPAPPVDTVLLLDLVREHGIAMATLYHRAKASGTLTHAPNPHAGGLGQRRMAPAVLRTNVAALLAERVRGQHTPRPAAAPGGPPSAPAVATPVPAAPPATQPKPLAVEVYPGVPTPAPTDATGLSRYVRADLITRLTRASMVVQLPVLDLVNVAVEEWLKDVEARP